MKMDEMILISVDDHITEPGDVFDNQLSGEALAGTGATDNPSRERHK